MRPSNKASRAVIAPHCGHTLQPAARNWARGSRQQLRNAVSDN